MPRLRLSSQASGDERPVVYHGSSDVHIHVQERTLHAFVDEMRLVLSLLCLNRRARTAGCCLVTASFISLCSKASAIELAPLDFLVGFQKDP